jgi:putative acetyltransferase
MAAAGERARLSVEAALWPDEVPLARALFLEYAAWLDMDLCFQGFDAELAGLPGGYAPPAGNLWFARADRSAERAVAGVVGLRPFGRDGRRGDCCEMKRLWVRPAYRRLGLGRRLAEQALRAAVELGYCRMRLDTVRHMTEAQALYASLGFRDRTAEVAEPHPDLIYMERDLARPRG